MDYDTEYLLSQFRKEQNGLFDENGKRYTGTGESYRVSEMMLILINKLEKEIYKLENAIEI